MDIIMMKYKILVYFQLISRKNIGYVNQIHYFIILNIYIIHNVYKNAHKDIIINQFV